MMDRWLDRLTPHTVRRWAVRTALASGPMAALLMVVWLMDADPLWHGIRPTAYLMLWLACLLTCCTSVIVAVGAALQLAISKAFGHGYRRAVDDMNTPRTLPVHPMPHKRPLSLVE